MAPNLFLITKTVFSPHRWFTRRPSVEKPVRKTEHWETPVPGTYEYIPGRGWFLVRPDSTKEGEDVGRPVPVSYSKVLKRNLLKPEYESRVRRGSITNDQGKKVEAGFFRLDDGIAWVHCWDENGEFIPGPYAMWCIDQGSGQFRQMLKKDSPEWVSKHSDSRRSSLRSSMVGSKELDRPGADGQGKGKDKSTHHLGEAPSGHAQARKSRSVGELKMQRLTIADDADDQRRGSAPEYFPQSQRSSQDRGSRASSYKGSGRSRPPSPYPRPPEGDHHGSL